MSKALESALAAVRRMSPWSEVDPDAWTKALEEMRNLTQRQSGGERIKDRRDPEKRQ